MQFLYVKVIFKMKYEPSSEYLGLKILFIIRNSKLLENTAFLETESASIQ
jgi:hypothetical protein